MSLAQYGVFIETLPDGVLLVNKTGIIELANSNFYELLGYQQSEVMGKSVHMLIPAAKRQAHERYVNGFVSSPSKRVMGELAQLTGMHQKGYEVPLDIMLNPIELDGSYYTICCLRDTSVMRSLKESLEKALEREKQLTMIDALTGAGNRRFFYLQAEYEIERARRTTNTFSIAYIDLDNFKQVNDRFGHHAGDEILRYFVEVCKTHLRKTDIISRLGGDEFALMMVNAEPTSLRLIVQRIIHDMKSYMDQNAWLVTLSIGVVSFVKPPETVELILRLSDQLMYSVKHSGKDSAKYSVYD
ncbi:diguanylate cyclase [Aliiglaciecola sp. LCG003]|nr:diguanylate cyclase [Aliiglaciecola sp. LCG003]WJG11312.1 diguanylate cyclase [Aliiglaciecola sp. LCG003]